MKEELLYLVWKYSLFRTSGLRTCCGQKLEIIHPGERNPDSGPDFFNAQVRIGPTRWAGNVEIHVRSSDWLAHGHTADPAYDNVILHVVFEHDREVIKSNGMPVPALELSSLINKATLDHFLQLVNSDSPVPCAGYFHRVSPLIFHAWIDRLVMDRLEKRTSSLMNVLRRTAGDWDICFYQVLARAFGFRTNADPFEMLARITPHNMLARKRENRVAVESMLFGQAGFLEAHLNDEYAVSLQNEFMLHQKKHDLMPMKASAWKFMRLRPRNFPTLRISQFASLICRKTDLLSIMLETEELEKVTGLFDVAASPYWNDHYMFDRKAGRIQSVMGWESACLIVLNAVIPFLFVYGRERGRSDLMNRAMGFLEEMKPENNAVIRYWEELGLKAKNGLQSQGLLQLRTEYCNHRRCTECAIGVKILSCEKTSVADENG